MDTKRLLRWPLTEQTSEGIGLFCRARDLSACWWREEVPPKAFSCHGEHSQALFAEEAPVQELMEALWSASEGAVSSTEKRNQAEFQLSVCLWWELTAGTDGEPWAGLLWLSSGQWWMAFLWSGKLEQGGTDCLCSLPASLLKECFVSQYPNSLWRMTVPEETSPTSLIHHQWNSWDS